MVGTGSQVSFIFDEWHRIFKPPKARILINGKYVERMLLPMQTATVIMQHIYEI